MISLSLDKTSNLKLVIKPTGLLGVKNRNEENLSLELWLHDSQTKKSMFCLSASISDLAKQIESVPGLKYQSQSKILQSATEQILAEMAKVASHKDILKSKFESSQDAEIRDVLHEKKFSHVGLPVYSDSGPVCEGIASGHSAPCMIQSMLNKLSQQEMVSDVFFGFQRCKQGQPTMLDYFVEHPQEFASLISPYLQAENISGSRTPGDKEFLVVRIYGKDENGEADEFQSKVDMEFISLLQEDVVETFEDCWSPNSGHYTRDTGSYNSYFCDTKGIHRAIKAYEQTLENQRQSKGAAFIASSANVFHDEWVEYEETSPQGLSEAVFDRIEISNDEAGESGNEQTQDIDLILAPSAPIQDASHTRPVNQIKAG